jgi:hypothetical protein
MVLTREERETIVRTSDADDCWVISTASPKFIRKFTKFLYKTDDAVLNPDGYQSFILPLNLVSFRRPRKKLNGRALDTKRRNLLKARSEPRVYQPNTLAEAVTRSQ